MFFFYGRKAIAPRNQALALIRESEALITSNEITLVDEIAQFKKYASLYEQASNINLNKYPLLGGYPILETYIKENYQLAKDILKYDEDVYAGKHPIEKGDYNDYIKAFVERRKAILNSYGSYRRTQLWMRLIFLK